MKLFNGDPHSARSLTTASTQGIHCGRTTAPITSICKYFNLGQRRANNSSLSLAREDRGEERVKERSAADDQGSWISESTQVQMYAVHTERAWQVREGCFSGRFHSLGLMERVIFVTLCPELASKQAVPYSVWVLCESPARRVIVIG